MNLNERMVWFEKTVREAGCPLPNHIVDNIKSGEGFEEALNCLNIALSFEYIYKFADELIEKNICSNLAEFIDAVIYKYGIFIKEVFSFGGS